MKIFLKFLKFFIVFLVVFLIVFYMHPKKIIYDEDSYFSSDENNVKKEDIPYTKYTSSNGWLKVVDSNIVSENNNIFQLTGISSHGLQWYSNLITAENLKSLKEDWNINVFRIAMYTEENGYISTPDKIKKELFDIVDICVNLNLYVIVDWHILSDNDPNIHINEAKDFFDEVSKKYSDTPNVIYEICNEPNGGNVTWKNNVKPYAETIINVIRKNSPKSLIIVGTPNWSKDLKSVVESPLNFENIAYSFHFYAGSHNVNGYKEVINNARKNNLCIFVSECGITDASGNGAIYKDEFEKWINYLNEEKISWIFWSFSNKAESSSLLTPDYIPTVTKEIEPTPVAAESPATTQPISTIEIEYNKIDNYITDVGLFVKNLLVNIK